MKKWLVSILAIVFIFALAACSTDQPGSDEKSDDADKTEEKQTTGDDAESFKIGFSISTQNNPFFIDLGEGAEEAAEANGLDIVVADAQDDPSKQISDIEDLIQQDIDILLVNPTDDEAVVAGIESANDAGIPVITVDRSANGGDVVTHIASDNIAGGEMAGAFIQELLGDGGGKMVELEGIPGVLATTERGEGFHNIIDGVDSIEVVANQTANFDRTEGLSVMENILQNHQDIVAVFAHNDEMALGAVEALEAQGMLDDVIVVGFDATDDARAAVEDGRMEATVAQQPKLISEKAVEAAIEVVAGNPVEDFIPVELELIK
ncbi:D-ribose ABC transporter substrate-binding protein [Pseudogracilibacillus sp. SO30301A]|uniref:D-ribose ABC transporter substrate-binding protein n=1 Tax=Pseudogracilibacillus sp. SO30301A TaxID=3098291 RepID=UPI00300DC796